MYISDVCIKRPVFALVLNLIIILIGIIGFSKLSVRGTPQVNPPVITIQTIYPGASPKYIERNITSVIERKIKTTKNIENIFSSSRSGVSKITVIFEINSDPDKVLNDLRSLVSEAMNFLPPDVNSPTISKMDSDNWPSLWITAVGPKYDQMVFSDIIEQRLLPALEKIESVSRAVFYTNYSYAIKINLDPLKLYQYKLTPIDIKNKILSQTKDYPAGSIKTQIRDFIINIDGTLNKAEEFGNIIIDNNKMIKLSDLAEIKLTTLDQDEIIRYNGKETVAIGLILDPKSNIIELSDEVRKKLPIIEKSLPDGIKTHIAYDKGIATKASINSVYETAFEALILVLIIVFLFLGTVNATIVPLVAIPVSIIGTFGFMYLSGFSINLFSLLAIIMSIGLVVDDAIVVLENVYHHIENGLTPIEAAFKASKEIGFVVIAMTFTLSAVFLPIGFIEGFVGKLFIEFAWTLAFCVIISGFVALTLSPMLASKMLNNKKEKKLLLVEKFNYFFHKLSEKYILYLSYVLNNIKIVFGTFLISVILLFTCFYFVKKEFMPSEDNSILLITASGREGAPISSTLKSAIEVESILRTIPEIEGYFLNAYGSDLFAFVPLKYWSERSKSAQQIIRSLNPLLSSIPYSTIYAINPGLMRGDFEKPISFYILSFDNFDYLVNLSKDFLAEMKKSPIFKEPERIFRNSMPTLQINLDRDKAAQYGILLDQVGYTLKYLIEGDRVAEFNVGNEKYPVMMGFDLSNKNKISDLSKIYIKSLAGKMIHLSSIADIKEEVSVLEYTHCNTAKAIEFGAELSGSYSIGDAYKEIERIKDKIADKTKFSIQYEGEIKNMQKSNSQMALTFTLAIIFIYLVLSAQFESFFDPLIILLSVPFSILGGVIFLLIFGHSLNLYSQIGLITLIGLITKNAIMIVEFANQMRLSGADKFEAIINSCKLRLRPIIMTNLATSIGAVPLMLASGASAASRSSIGVVIVGGIIIGTFFTLFVIPSIYFRFKK